MTDGIVIGDDGVARCSWGESTPDYRAYHDREWGFPVLDDVRLFEKLALEGFQSGLSWLTILRKRENFRRAFAGFEIDAVARFGARDIKRLLGDAGIVRNRAKIEATINNARCCLELIDGTALSKALRKRGWAFVGPTTAYAFMQAMGLVNDHVAGCAIREEAEADRARFRLPSPQ